MEDLVGELKMNIFERIRREIEEKTKLQKELENSTNILENKLKVANEFLTNRQKTSTLIINENTILEHSRDRLDREIYHMSSEITLLKKRIQGMKNELFTRDNETQKLNYEIYRDESDVTFLQDETRRLNKKVIDLQEEKKCVRTAIVLLKKQTDLLKEKVMKEEYKNQEFITDVSTLIKRGKI
jgi:chromosome segregation ATPase